MDGTDGLWSRVGLAASFLVLTLAVSPPAVVGQTQADLADTQARLLADPGNLEKIMALQNDPRVQAILEDPDTMRAVRSGNFDALKTDPKIRAMLGHPTVRDLSR